MDGPRFAAVLCHGVWLFVDWLGFAGIDLDAGDAERVRATAGAELEANRRDPYRSLSRVFDLVGARVRAEVGSFPGTRGQRRSRRTDGVPKQWSKP